MNAIKGSILVVEDEAPHAEAIAEGLRRFGFECRIAESGADAVEQLDEQPFDVVITDYKLGGAIDGMEVIRRTKKKWPETEVILITAHGSEQLARDALRQERAFDYLVKPIDLDEIRDLADRAAKQAQSNREHFVIRRRLDEPAEFRNIVAVSPQMQRILRLVKQVAPTNITVLLQGESGTGKDLLARAIHEHSPRSDRRMVTLDCAGLSEGVLESELFGHVKGAFTGAISSRKGRFEYADGSTLFLDEIGEMPLTMQAKLLRVLETREIVPVGSNDPVRVDVRLVSATNRDLAKAVEEEKFRQDLYFRLKSVTLRIPPLRERREDIPVMIEQFIRNSNETHGRAIKGISPDAREMLIGYDWPGNVRELRNVIDSMVVLTAEQILGVEDVPEEIRQQAGAARSTAIVPLTSMAGQTLEQLEKEHIQNTLEITRGNREQAAKILGIAPRTLYRKIKEYGL
ncbi:MAG: sigma-54-dependent Fis family transcriptional regulator [Phycisphaerae bacterium]|nr:sigma-54-dependent Fis family transcriptional regulator [Phycisphaerae bacterium]